MATNQSIYNAFARFWGHVKTLVGAIDTRVTNLESAIGENGSVATNITEAINNLDADITSAAVESGKGIKVQVVETDGKITAVNVSGSFDNKYDAFGAASTVNGDLLTYKTNNDNAVSGLNTRIGTIENDYLKTADKTSLQNQITTNANAIQTLSDGVDPEKVDGVKDLISYVESHGTEVSGMRTSIQNNTNSITAINNEIGDIATEDTEATGLYKLITDGDNALISQINVINGKITDLENSSSDGSTHTHDYLPLAGGTMTGTINSSKTTDTYLQGNQGQAIINSTASGDGYTTLAKMNSLNGYFTQSAYRDRYILAYTNKASVDANSDIVTKSVTLLDESGNTTFPGIVTASTFDGTAEKATKDSVGQQINTTYIKDLVATSEGLTIVKGDDTMNTIGISGSISISYETLPVGSVLIWSGDVIPAGYELYDIITIE